MHLANTLADFYERDLRKLAEEINLFKHEEHLWQTSGSITNSAGNLALHIIGGVNHLVGATLAHTGYMRSRNQEFAIKHVPRHVILAQLQDVTLLVPQTINNLTEDQLQAEYPIFFDKPGTSTAYVLLQLALHLNYHLGQVNYLRRVLE